MAKRMISHEKRMLFVKEEFLSFWVDLISNKRNKKLFLYQSDMGIDHSRAIIQIEFFSFPKNES